MYSFEHYIHFVDGKVTEDNLPKEVVVNDTTITFKYGEPIQLHVVVDVKNEMSLHYVFEDNVHAEVIETRHVKENGVLNRTFTNGAYSHVNFFNENEGTGKNTYLDEGHSSHDSMLQLGYSELSDASIEASYTFELDGEGRPITNTSQEVTVNKLPYVVDYKVNEESTSKAVVGDQVVVTNSLRTKMLPSAGSRLTLVYRQLGLVMVVAGFIVLLIIYKNRDKKIKEEEIGK